MGRRRSDTAVAGATEASEAGHKPRLKPRGRHYKPKHRQPLWLRIGVMAVASVLVLVLAVGGLLFFRLQHNVRTAPLDAAVSPKPNSGPAESTGSLQVLILGTDTREGSDSEYGSTEDSSGEGNSDVMLLMNISADNSQVSVTSFPRDLMVPIPSCKSAETGQVLPAIPMGQLNAALKAAGPGCTVAAINAMTGLTIDHFMLADFTAVKELSSALGGVEVCVDHAMNDWDGSHLKLPAGKSLVQGEQALGFLRTRHAFGDSSDLARIKAQQYFLGSMVRKIKSEGTLTNLPRLYKFADVVTKNLTIDESLANVPAMIDIASRLSKINLDNIAFVTVPWESWTQDANRIQLKEPDAGQYFAALRSDTPLTKVNPSPQPGTTPSSSPSQGTSPSASADTQSPAAQSPDTTPSPATVSPSAAAYQKALQPISVQNASAVPGRGAQIQQTLISQGFTATSVVGDFPAANQSQILYGADMADVANDLAQLFKLPATAVKEDSTISGVSVVVGTDWSEGDTFGTVVVPKDIVSSTANQTGECLTVNPLYWAENAPVG